MLPAANRVQQCSGALSGNWEDVSNLYAQQSEDSKTPFNYPAWLRLCAEVRGGTLFKVYRGEELIGLLGFRSSAFRAGGQKLEGLVPLPFPCADFVCPIVQQAERLAFWTILIDFFGKEMAGTPVLLEHLRREDAEIVSMICGPPIKSIANPVRENNVLPFAEVLKKKSLKRHKNAFLRAGILSVSHDFTGPGDHVQVLAAMHRERWGFEGQPSILAEEQTFQLYSRSFSEASCDGGGSPAVVLTTVRWNNETVAMHFGYVWHKTFLYHLPAINIKYINQWPGEVLMYELFSFAVDQQLEVFDFGVGDESYKSRYASTVEHYHSFLLNNSRQFAFMANAARLADRVRRLVSPRAIVRRLISRKDDHAKDVVRFYHSPAFQVSPEHDLIEFTYAEYVNYARVIGRRPYGLSRGTYERFQQGWRLFALRVQDSPVAFGWVFAGNSVYLSELEKSVQVSSGAIWLLDFYTFEADRGKGYYGSLLKHLASQFCKDNPVIVYARESNSPSIRGIEKAGFEYFANCRPREGLVEVNSSGSSPSLS